MQFDSKENDQTAHPAQLDITLANSGPQGATGATGVAGAAGPAGVAGAAGAAGAAGPQGAQGIAGPPGRSGSHRRNRGSRALRRRSLRLRGLLLLHADLHAGTGRHPRRRQLHLAPELQPWQHPLLFAPRSGVFSPLRAAPDPQEPREPPEATGPGPSGRWVRPAPRDRSEPRGPQASWGNRSYRSNSGATGAIGPQGPTGLAGATGATGVAGATGAAGPAVATYQGNYVSTTNYALNNAVSFNGSTYISLVASNHGNTPDQSPADWAVLAGPGPTGPAGTTGPAGPVGGVGPAGAIGPAGPAGATGPPISFLGAWSNTQAYTPGEAVSWNGSSYAALVTNLAKTPDQSPTYWGLLAQQGRNWARRPCRTHRRPGCDRACRTRRRHRTSRPTGATGDRPGPPEPPASTTAPPTDSTVNYALNDAVTFQGATYISIATPNAGNTPGLNPVRLESSGRRRHDRPRRRHRSHRRPGTTRSRRSHRSHRRTRHPGSHGSDRRRRPSRSHRSHRSSPAQTAPSAQPEPPAPPGAPEPPALRGRRSPSPESGPSPPPTRPAPPSSTPAPATSRSPRTPAASPTRPRSIGVSWPNKAPPEPREQPEPPARKAPPARSDSPAQPVPRPDRSRWSRRPYRSHRRNRSRRPHRRGHRSHRTRRPHLSRHLPVLHQLRAQRRRHLSGLDLHLAGRRQPRTDPQPVSHAMGAPRAAGRHRSHRGHGSNRSRRSRWRSRFSRSNRRYRSRRDKRHQRSPRPRLPRSLRLQHQLRGQRCRHLPGLDLHLARRPQLRQSAHPLAHLLVPARTGGSHWSHRNHRSGRRHGNRRPSWTLRPRRHRLHRHRHHQYPGHHRNRHQLWHRQRRRAELYLPPGRNQRPSRHLDLPLR